MCPTGWEDDLTLATDDSASHGAVIRTRLIGVGVTAPTPSDTTTFYEIVGYLDEAVIRALWSKTFKGFGRHGSMVVRDEGTISWIVESVRRAGSNREPAWCVAGCGLYRTVTGHAFIDCNHRTGWLLSQTLMECAGYELTRPTNEVVRFVKSIDGEGRDEEEVKEWVRRAFLRLG